VNKIILFFKSKAFKEGYNSGKSSLQNPYADVATQQNIREGMGASPWWDTNHKEFWDWDKGFRKRLIEKYPWTPEKAKNFPLRMFW
jgi:hypothetical protein